MMPDVSGSLVVWQDERGTLPDVWYLDLAGGFESPVAPGSAPADRRAPQVSGRRVVWQQRASSIASWDIYQRDV
jgi:hypothetical protein